MDPDDGGAALIETAVHDYVEAAGRLTGSQCFYSWWKFQTFTDAA